MPGVPSSRACEACRHQKKKCDETQPTCSRCLRLAIPCIGSGQQRYKFQPQPQIQAPIPTRLNQAILANPSAAITTLAASLISIIKPTCPLRYNLWWSYGAFFNDIPARLGTNEALDASISALTVSHSSFCIHRTVSIEALRRYSRALGILRSYLTDPARATSSETLCAVLVLIFCQSFIGSGNLCWSGHVEGAAKILKARGRFGARNDFERKIMLSLRGCVLVEGLYNDKIQLSPQEWVTLIENDFDKDTPGGYMLRCFARAPLLLQRGREVFYNDDSQTLTELKHEIGGIYAGCKRELDTLRLRLRTWATSDEIENHISQFVYASHQRTYGLGLSIILVFNSMLSALGLDSSLVADAACLSEEAVVLARQAAIYRPVGAGHAIFCLWAAGAATTESHIRTEIEALLQDYLQDFGEGKVANMKGLLNQKGRRLRFGIGMD